VNGFPIYLEIQLQVGTWLITVQTASTPHTPGQGSTHLFPIQALFVGQSEL